MDLGALAAERRARAAAAAAAASASSADGAGNVGSEQQQQQPVAVPTLASLSSPAVKAARAQADNAREGIELGALSAAAIREEQELEKNDEHTPLLTPVRSHAEEEETKEEYKEEEEEEEESGEEQDQVGLLARGPRPPTGPRPPADRGRDRDRQSSNVSIHIELPEGVSYVETLPDDMFTHILRNLNVADLACVANVSREWKKFSYDASLWLTLDLSSLYNRVDDRMVASRLQEPRFSELTSLSLEGCSAVTDRSLQAIQTAPCARTLKRVMLSDCRLLQPHSLIAMARALPQLRRLELYGVTQDFLLAAELQAVRPGLDLGLFYMEYCAHTGTPLRQEHQAVEELRADEDEEVGAGPVAQCRHADPFAERPCWGPVRGRLVYASGFPKPGNYPTDILYSCQNHADQDFVDETYHSCQLCDRLFKEKDMLRPANQVCKVCCDGYNLQKEGNWIDLTAPPKNFAFGDVLNKALRVCDKANLPRTLRSYGTVRCLLDYQVSERRRQRFAHHGQPETQVPVSVFLDHNRRLIEQQTSEIRTKLEDARRNEELRALLVVDERERVTVLADKRAILTRRGEGKLLLINNAWSQFLHVLAPILVSMLCVLYFRSAVRRYADWNDTFFDGVIDTVGLLQDEPGSDNTELIIALIFIGAMLLVMGCLVFLAWRFGEACRRCFLRFLVIDIWLIFLGGCGVLGYLLFRDMNVEIEMASFFVGCWNFGAVGLVSMYHAVPPNQHVHHIFLLALNIIVAVLLVQTMYAEINLVILFIVVAMDVVSELRPNMNLLVPFIMPTTFEMIYSTPRLIYQVGGMRLRGLDFLWYGLMVGQVGFYLESFVWLFIGVIASVVLTVFVVPYMGKSRIGLERLRPLPVAFLAMVLIMWLEGRLFSPYQGQFIQTLGIEEKVFDL